MFRKVLVANRGEIAVRIIRALRELSIPSVAVYSDVDRASLHVRMADEAVAIGPALATESYLRGDKLIAATRRTGADAIHPGYGFLSENADFAHACGRARLTFIGPPVKAIRVMGSKLAARKLALHAGVPVIPGTDRPLKDFAHARKAAAEIGYPVLLKASAGGGGKGMRLVESDGALDAALRDAASEAERAFNSREIYLEKALVRSRHIEVQVLGDRFGHLIHLGERECSIQRRHQKVVEECPSPFVAAHPELRAKMGAAAVKIAQAAGYHNAGTVEFLVEPDGHFYFLEMNTRLQVEHPVTEMVTALDLVHWQIRLAAGQRLTLKQEDVRWHGSAIECRIYAEQPENQFIPSPGKILQLERPAGPGVRVDSGVYPHWTVPVDYDPLLAKLIVWAGTRDDAIRRSVRALSEYYITGIRTNIGFFRELLLDPEFAAGRLHTSFLDDYFDRRQTAPPDPELLAVAALIAAVHDQRRTEAVQLHPAPASAWRSTGRARLHR